MMVIMRIIIIFMIIMIILMKIVNFRRFPAMAIALAHYLLRLVHVHAQRTPRAPPVQSSTPPAPPGTIMYVHQRYCMTIM